MNCDCIIGSSFLHSRSDDCVLLYFQAVTVAAILKHWSALVVEVDTLVAVQGEQ
jgi:hypothetical protein